MFLRRCYYSRANGSVLYLYDMAGHIAPLSQADEAAARGLENWGCLEWTAPDADVEQKMTENRTLAVEPLTGALVWGEAGSAVQPGPVDALLAELDDANATIAELDAALLEAEYNAIIEGGF